MSQSNRQKSIIYKGFSDGIDLTKSHSGEKNIYDMVNLDISSDGCAVTRNGFKKLYPCTAAPSAVWGGRLEGTYRCFFVAENYVYLLDIHTKETSIIGSIGASRALKFFYYRDALYLQTNGGFYKVTPTDISEVLGYVPLYGKDWGTTFAGEINEPLNILNGKARISYTVPEEYSTLLSTGISVRGVEAVYKNGELLPSDSYSLDSRYPAISVPEILPGDKLVVCVSFDLDASRDALFSSTHSEVFGGINNDRLFMWGNEKRNLMFASAYVSGNSLSESEDIFPDCGPLYFPENHEFSVGSGKHEITSVLRHFDRLLIFTEGDTWMADTSACGLEPFPVMNINSVVGCDSSGGSARLGNSPISAWRAGIYIWSSYTDELNDCNAEPISLPVADYISSSFTKGCIIFKNPYKNELWMHSPADADCIWIYNGEHRAWYRYIGDFSLSGFFDADGNVGFFSNNGIYTFSKDQSFDENDGGTASPISAYIRFKNLNFGTTQKKRLSNLIIHSISSKESINLELRLNTGQAVQATVKPSDKYSRSEIRLCSDRFEFLSEVTVSTTSCNYPHTICDIQLYAR